MIARDTDDLLHCHKLIRENLLASVDEPDLLTEFLKDVDRRPNTPCILYQQRLANRHITVPAKRCYGLGKTWMVSVARAVFAVAGLNVRTHLLKNEEALHTCGQNGEAGTGHGCCVNPHHVVRGTDKDRMAAKVARYSLRKTFRAAATNEPLCHAGA